MSARDRVLLVVALAALGSVAVVVAVAQRGDRAAAVTPPGGEPPLVLDLGVRADREARDLRRAVALYNDGRTAAARRLFGRYGSLEARIGAAVARWPAGTLDTLRRLVREHPDSGAARLHLGVALFWSGLPGNALEAWRATRRVEPDSSYALRAEDLLYPDYFRGRPPFVPFFDAPELAQATPAKRLAALERAARRGGVREKLLYGVALQRLERPVSALGQFEAARALAPEDSNPQIAVAVASFDKARPQAAFAQLGPLSRRYPESGSVRFHLGLLLLWLNDREGATRQLELARDSGETRVSAEATRVLRGLGSTRTRREGG